MLPTNEIFTFRQTMGYFSDHTPDPNTYLVVRATLKTLTPVLAGKTGEIFREETDSCGCCTTDTLVAKVENGEVLLQPAIPTFDPYVDGEGGWEAARQ